jgi:hypothetical protein
VQPSSAHVRVSPKARTIGSAPAARLPLRLSTTMLGLFPHPSRANSSRPRHTPRRSASLWSHRVGCRPLGPPPMWCWSRWLGSAGWAWPEGSAPPGRRMVGGQTGPAPPGQPRSARRSRGAGSREPAQRGRRSRPGQRLDAGELFAWVGGSSVSLTCSCADQGGCHVDMVVGADHRGRCRVGVRRDAEPSPLTAPLPARSRLELLLDQADGLAAWPVRPGPAGAADHPALPGPAGSGTSPVLPALLALQHAGDSP